MENRGPKGALVKTGIFSPACLLKANAWRKISILLTL